MRIPINIFLILAFNLVTPIFVFSQVYNCDGRWTNIPCNIKTKNTLTENTRESEEQIKFKRDKQSELHELRMKALKFREDFKEDFKISEVEIKCEKSEVTLEECKKEIIQAIELLNKKRNELEIIKTQKEAIELKKKEIELQKERNKIEAEKPAVVINNDIIVLPKKRKPLNHRLESSEDQPKPHPLPRIN